MTWITAIIAYVGMFWAYPYLLDKDYFWKGVGISHFIVLVIGCAFYAFFSFMGIL